MAGEVKARARLSPKNQMTVPVAVLEAAHLAAGDELEVEVRGDGEFLVRRRRSRWDGLIGTAPGLSAAADLEALRDEWER